MVVIKNAHHECIRSPGDEKMQNNLAYPIKSPIFAIPIRNGALAERLGTGLQNLLQRFDSARHLSKVALRYLRATSRIKTLLLSCYLLKECPDTCSVPGRLRLKYSCLVWLTMLRRYKELFNLYCSLFIRFTGERITHPLQVRLRRV